MENANKIDFWFILHPYVYSSVLNNQFLLYNTLNGEIIKSSDPELFYIVKRLINKKNGYVLRLKKKELSSNMMDFIREVREKYFGDLIESVRSKCKPVQMYPKLNLQNIQKEMTYKIHSSKLLKNDTVKEFVETVSIYINSECKQDCYHCNSSYYQFSDCYKSKSDLQLYAKEFQDIIEELNGSSLQKLKIMGGNILFHKELDIIKHYLDKIPVVTEYYLNYLNLVSQPKKTQMLQGKGNKLIITIHFPCDKSLIEKIFKESLYNLSGISLRFMIESKKDYDQAIEIIREYNIKDSQLTPYYNQKNLGFFKIFLFVTEDILANSKISLTEIFNNQVFNRNSFKNLTITANKKVYGNINRESLGSLDKYLLMDLVVKEMNSCNSWHHTRSMVTPCKSCLYKNICPPISNYEYFMNRFNICQIK